MPGGFEHLAGGGCLCVHLQNLGQDLNGFDARQAAGIEKLQPEGVCSFGGDGDHQGADVKGCLFSLATAADGKLLSAQKVIDAGDLFC